MEDLPIPLVPSFLPSFLLPFLRFYSSSEFDFASFERMIANKVRWIDASIIGTYER